MTRFRVYPNPDGNGYLIDVQADSLSHFNTRMVIPLLPLDVAPKPAKTLNPLFDSNNPPAKPGAFDCEPLKAAI
jgi:toxin CcdB